MNESFDQSDRPFQHRGRTPSQRADAARINRPKFTNGSSLRAAVSDGITDFWRDLSSVRNGTAATEQPSEGSADVIAKMLLWLYDPEELLFDAIDERLFQSEDLRWRQPLTGDETCEDLVRSFASVAGLRLDQVDRGFRGSRVAIVQEFFRYAERYKNHPDLIVALLKGVLVRTLTNQPAFGGSFTFGCNVVSGILDHAWGTVDSSSRTTRQFMSELASFVCIGLNQDGWQDMIEIAIRLIELMERMEDETGETAVVLTTLWHRLLQSLVAQATATPRLSDRVWLHWFAWVALGFAAQLQKIYADSETSENRQLTQLVDRLSEYAVVAAMRSIVKLSTKVNPRSTIAVLLQGIDNEERERAWLTSPHHYQQLCEAILVVSPCWQARFTSLRTPEALLQRIFHFGLAAVVALIIEDDAQDQVLRWLDVAEAIRVFRRDADDTTLSEDRIALINFNNLLKVEELFVWWLALGVAFNAKEFRYVMPCLEKVWSLLDNLLSGRKGYNAAGIPVGLGTIREQSLIWLSRYDSQEPSYATKLANLQQVIVKLTGPMTESGRESMELPQEYQSTFDSLVKVIGSERNTTPLVCPTIDWNDGNSARDFCPAVAGYWKNIFDNLSARFNRSIDWMLLLKRLVQDMATLHEFSENRDTFSLPDVFGGVFSKTYLISQERQTLVDQNDSNWEHAGPLAQGSALIPDLAQRTMSDWLEHADLSFLCES